MWDDAYSLDELPGQCRIEVFSQIMHGDHPLLKQKEDQAISEPAAAQLANAVANKLINDCLDDIQGTEMNGEMLYEVQKVTDQLRKIMDEYVEEFVEEGLLFADPPEETLKLKIDSYSDQGRRNHMEDRHVCLVDLNAIMGLEEGPSQAFFGVYDGHGGVDAAKFAQAQLYYRVASHPKFNDDVKTSLLEGFSNTDEAFLKKCKRDAIQSGATACTALIRDNKLYIAWLGDSQAALCRGGEAIPLMKPHKPQNEDEKARIEAAGGVVVWYGAWRVNGVLSVSRAIGDMKLKQWVVGDAEVAEFDLDGREDFLVLACDGLWDCMKEEEVIEFVKTYKSEHGNDGKGAAKELVRHCLDKLSGSDNISVIVVFFEK